MNESRVEQAIIGIAVLLTVTFMVFGVMLSVNCFDEGWMVCGIMGLLGVLGGAGVLAGLYISRRSPTFGGTLTVCGALPMAAMMWWSVFVPILSVLVAAFAVVRAQRFASTRDALA